MYLATRGYRKQIENRCDSVLGLDLLPVEKMCPELKSTSTLTLTSSTSAMSDDIISTSSSSESTQTSAGEPQLSTTSPNVNSKDRISNYFFIIMIISYVVIF